MFFAIHSSNTAPKNTTSPLPTPISITTKSTPSTYGKNINVLSIAYYPLRDGKLDTVTAIKDTYNEYPFTLQAVQQKVKRLTTGVVTALQKGTKNYLTYSVIDRKEFLEAIPLRSEKYNGLPLPNYMQMMEKVNVCDYVDNKEVREVWIWSYAGTGKAGWESNFSSKTYGDISNSNRDPTDLPYCKHSYTVYDYNYGREVAEAVHDHTHQYEQLFGEINNDLFWNKFVGSSNHSCGWTHFPPNGTKDYDYENTTNAQSTCSHWYDSKPIGETTNCSAWGCNQLSFLIWWMQHIPGYNNSIQMDDKDMRNWWDFVADYDTTIQEGKSLFVPAIKK
jgi:hypothetical protein